MHHQADHDSCYQAGTGGFAGGELMQTAVSGPKKKKSAVKDNCRGQLSTH